MADHITRWHVRYSLRSGLLAVTALAIVLGIMAWARSRAELQEEAVAAIEEIGGWVRYDRETQDAWLLNRLGRHYFDTVTTVSIPADYHLLANLPSVEWLEVMGAEFDESSTSTLCGLHQLKELSLCNISLTEYDLARLAGLALHSLNLHSCDLPVSAAANLKKLRGLRRLAITYSALDESSLLHLGALPNLQILDLDGTTVAPEAFHRLSMGKSFPRLTSLNLSSASIGDDSVAQLVNALSLSELGLGNTDISDAALKHLAELHSLQRLYLNYTDVTDHGLLSLATADRLEQLDVCGTQVTPKGLGPLADHPALKIVHVSRYIIENPSPYTLSPTGRPSRTPLFRHFDTWELTNATHESDSLLEVLGHAPFTLAGRQ